MQFNQQPGMMPGINDGRRQNQGQDFEYHRTIQRIRSRTRRQFLATASGLFAGTALLIGGEAWFSQSNPLASLTNHTVCKVPTISPAHPVKLAVGQAGKSIAFFRYYVAQQEGYFKSHGLDMVDPIQMTNGAALTAALESGTLQVGNGVITDAFSLTRTDSSVRIIGTLLNAYAVDIVVGKNFMQEMNILTSSSVTDKLNALKGKKIGITGPNTGTQALLTYLFRQEGLDATTAVKQVSLGSSSATALASLKEGHVDAVSYFVPFGQIAEAQGVGEIYISPLRGDIPQLIGDAQGVYYTRQSVIDAQPGAIVAYIQAMSQAADFIHSNPDETKVHLSAYLGLSPSLSNTVYTAALSSIAQDPQISQTAYNIAGQFHVKAGLVSVIPSYDKLVATSTIQTALGSGTTSCPS